MAELTGRRSGALITILILLSLFCYFVAFGIINFPGFTDFATTDMYEDTLVARLMWEKKSLFPENYLFGNQFYVIATPVLSALFYGITGSMNLSMGLATTVMSLLILLSLNWMLSPFVRQRHIRYAALLTLVASVYGPNTVVREDGQLFFVMCSFYACYLIIFFYLMGDYARSRQSEDMRPAAFAAALLLSFCTGMQSLRQTCVSMLPILCFELMAAFFRLMRREKLWPRDKRMPLIRASSYLAANIAGMLFIRLLGVSRNEIYYGQSIFNGASISGKLNDLYDAIVTVSGYDFTRDINEPFFILLFVFFTLIIVAAAFILIRSRQTGGCACFWYLCIISILAVIAASFFTSVRLRPIYLFTYYTLPALSFVILADRIRPRLQNILCILLVCLATANIYYSYHTQLEDALSDDVYNAKLVSDYAVENGFELIYGSHSYSAPVIAVQSDGKLIAGCWADDIIFKVSPHINIKDVYYLSDYSRALFVFREHELKLAEIETQANGTELTFLKQIGPYYLYTASNQLLYPISEAINITWRFPEYN